MTTKTLPADRLSRASMADMTFLHYFEILPEDVEYQDLFDPSFWRHHVTTKVHSIIRCRSPLGTFDVDLTVKAQVAGGLVMEFRGGRPPAGVNPYEVESEAYKEFKRIKVAPIGNDGKPQIRVEHLPKTKWRVLGLGATEISRGHETRIEAETVMNNYLNSINMRNPSAEELHAASEKKLAEKPVEKPGEAQKNAA
jgi:hypothetical protein